MNSLPGVSGAVWRTIAAVALVLIATFGLGFSCGRRGDADATDQLRRARDEAREEVAADFADVQTARAETDAELARLRDSIAAIKPAEQAATRAAARADSLGKTWRLAEKADVPTVPVAVDTTAFALIVRTLADSTQRVYQVPRFFLDVVFAERAARDSIQNVAYLLENRLDQAQRLAVDRIAAERQASDSLDASRAREVALSDSLARVKQPRCGAKCGGVIVIGGAIIARIVWSALEALVR